MPGPTPNPERPPSGGTAFFDLDNTLLGGDSDYLWGAYLAEIEAVPREEHRRENERFFREYQEGVLNLDEFLAFQLRPLADHAVSDLVRWRARFLDSWIAPLILPAAQALLEHHRRTGRRLVIVTSTNSFISRPIAERLGVRELLATEPEFDGGSFTGRVEGVPCAREGKVAHVRTWLRRVGRTLKDSWFYTDSIQDLALLEFVENPVPVVRVGLAVG